MTSTTRICSKSGAFNGFFAEMGNNYFTFGDFVFFTFVPFNYALYTLGIGSLVFKKKTYYLLIEYLAESGLINTVVFSPQSKDMRFLNELNAARNKYSSNKTNSNQKIEDSSVEEKLTSLKKIFNQELISEEEYNTKKAELLAKL